MASRRNMPAAEKWLLIVVDGDAALGQYWRTILSEYIQKIVRYFCGNSRSGQVCEVGLVMYNANSDLGCDVQFMQWTRDVDDFLGRLLHLAFNGDGPNVIVEGLAEALLMYPRRPTGTPTREYYKGERHCIVVTASEPFPGEMLMALPKIRDGQLVGSEIENCRVNYRRVARMFTPLAVSLSVISPNQRPVFREIFNLGNNVPAIASVYNSSGSSQFTVLLSDKLKAARNTFKCKAIADVSTQSIQQPNQTTTNVTLSSSITSGGSEDLFWHGQIAEEPTLAAAKAVRHEPEPVTSQDSQSQVASSSTVSLDTMYDDIMAELNFDNDVFPPTNTPKTCTATKVDNLNELFQPNQVMRHFNDIEDSLDQQQSVLVKDQAYMEALAQIQAKFGTALLGADPQNISNDQTNSITACTANPFGQALLGAQQNISRGQTSITASTSNSSKELVKNVVHRIGIIILDSRGNISNSSRSALNNMNNSWTSVAPSFLPQNSTSAQPIGQSGIMTPTTILQGVNARDTHIPSRGAFGSITPRAMSTNTEAGLQGVNAWGAQTLAKDAFRSITPYSISTNTEAGLQGVNVCGTHIPSRGAFSSITPHAMSTNTQAGLQGVGAWETQTPHSISTNTEAGLQGVNAWGTQPSSRDAFGSITPHAMSTNTEAGLQGVNAWDTQILARDAFGSITPYSISTNIEAELQGVNAWGTQTPTRGAFGSITPHAISTYAISTNTEVGLQGLNAWGTKTSSGVAFGSITPHAMSTNAEASLQGFNAWGTQTSSGVAFGSITPHAISTRAISTNTKAGLQGFNAWSTQTSSGFAFGSTFPSAVSPSGIMKTCDILQGINARDNQIPSGKVAFGSNIVPYTMSTSGVTKTDGMLQGTSSPGTQIPSGVAFGFTAPQSMSTSGVMRTAPMVEGFNSLDTQTSAGLVAFGSIAPHHAVNNSYIQPSSLSCQSPYVTSQSTSISRPLVEQNLSGYKNKRNLMSAFGSPAPEDSASTSAPSTAMPQRTNLRVLLPSIRMEHQHDYVKAWEGAITGILQNAGMTFNEARAYRKVTSRRTLTVQWPGWLQISRTMRQSIVNDSICMSQTRVDYVIFEVSMSNNTDLHDCLRSREFCAKLNLPSQTMFLTPTEHRNRFIGTILQGKQDLTALRLRQQSSSGQDKAAEGPNKKMKEMQHPHT